MKKGTFSILFIFFIAVMVSRLPRVALGEPRDQIVQITCQKQIPQNLTNYVATVVAALEIIKLEIQTQGYGAVSSRRGHDVVYALSQCYGDLSVTDCVICYSEARTFSPQCNSFTGVRTFLDGCFMRIENYNFFQEYTGLEDKAVCGNRTRKNSAFQETTRRVVLQAASYAPNNNGYARAELPISGARNESAYVLAECWRTLNANYCKACLENASTSILECLPWSEGRALNTGCYMRYSDINFLNPIPSNSSSRGTQRIVIAVCVSSAFVLAGAIVIGAYIWNHRRIEKKRKGSYDVKKLVRILHDSSLNFKYSILEKATNGFDEANKLGQGGFGTVYKGVLPDGREIAIKRLFLNAIHSVPKLYNEVNIISRVEHKNLVRLLGCSCSGPESLLVYEFLPNKSLDHFIFAVSVMCHDWFVWQQNVRPTPLLKGGHTFVSNSDISCLNFTDSKLGKMLNWEKRFVIIMGIAEGLVYLHENTETRIIHRDIKASNILLDTKLRAKIGDFGLAKSFQEDKSHIITTIAGTLGYMAPEYLFSGKLTEKADVYSFGVLLLEIITGRRNNESNTSGEYFKGMIIVVWKHFQQGTVEELIDPNLRLHNYHDISVETEVLRVIHVGLLCTQEIPLLRPSMSKALQMLANEEEHLPPPTNPPFIDEKTILKSNGTIKNSSNSLISGNFDSVATISQSTFYTR